MSTLLADGPPKLWYCTICLSEPHLLDSFTDFISRFKEHFGNSNLAYNTNNKLKKLVQTGSAAAYASQFSELLVHVNWTEETKIDMFYNGLEASTKDLISNTKCENRPKKYVDYTKFTIDCDNHVHEREQEHKDNSKRSVGNGSSSSLPKSGKSTTTSSSTSDSSSNSLPQGEPMQIDATKNSKPQGKLTNTEQKHRIDNGLCLYCSKYSKTTDTCPNCSPQAIKRMEEHKANSTKTSPSAGKDTPVPVLAVDDRPIASGLITQEVISQICVGSHNEVIPLSTGYNAKMPRWGILMKFSGFQRISPEFTTNAPSGNSVFWLQIPYEFP
ncbi:hypothetical protein VKT23_017799 [Stygiomarasmius scandens]|uniref:Retrotransposon gag domain-containing protein n=1 Tax=Marasmiellus scandens TaxID=2682957 RepID=A0ABR1IQX1_9AGAR